MKYATTETGDVIFATNLRVLILVPKGTTNAVGGASYFEVSSVVW